MTSWLNLLGFNRRSITPRNRIPIATLVMLGLIVLAGGLVAVWFSGNGTLSHLFAQLQAIQNHPPMWLEVLIMSITLLILLAAPKSDRYEWFDLRRLVRLQVNGQVFWGVTTFISEVGVHLYQFFMRPRRI